MHRSPRSHPRPSTPSVPPPGRVGDRDGQAWVWPATPAGPSEQVPSSGPAEHLWSPQALYGPKRMRGWPRGSPDPPCWNSPARHPGLRRADGDGRILELPLGTRDLARTSSLAGHARPPRLRLSHRHPLTASALSPGQPREDARMAPGVFCAPQQKPLDLSVNPSWIGGQRDAGRAALPRLDAALPTPDAHPARPG